MPKMPISTWPRHPGRLQYCPVTGVEEGSALQGFVGVPVRTWLPYQALADEARFIDRVSQREANELLRYVPQPLA